MIEKLQGIEERYEALEQQLAAPEIYSDPGRLARLSREQKELSPLVTAFRRYKKALSDRREAQDLLEREEDPDFRAMLQEELEAAAGEEERLAQELRVLLLPQDPDDRRNVIVEIRSGAGGDEAALFAHSLYRMYSMYAELRRWKTEVIASSITELGGVKEICFRISGEGVYSRLKFESGVHRVQRVPETESGGRIHTSTVTVAVLPEAEEVDVAIQPEDLQIDTYRSSGAGGQHVNKTESAIRITHLPTGLVVECQDERSQHKNRERAMSILRTRLYEQERARQNAARAAERKSQVGTGMRNERIRTYNFPQGRVTDHRIGLTLYKLDAVLNGSLDEIIDGLVTAERAERLGAGEDEA
ncbi:MAG: peptide chain release factor 1 [Oscillospiraceae bacterium]|nr:peptide chain release factor 1 [Oscillospiraceae bacterium]